MIYGIEFKYTKEEEEKIKKVKSVLFGAFPLTLYDEDKWLFTTEEGISEQVEKFIHNVGLIFYITFKDGVFEMSKKAVDKSKEKNDG